ncbi:undecaprenyl pyrophosphate phosphatase [Psychromonas ingrahamii 37]|uniref:Z-ring associated protein G n=1 Tax=Psychromonas ingrahamii (strain DSM 17664 / CCUG 51855 / 37) TaxID=357804 RepID=A1SXG8_PSYIN|nr:DUF1043 family protein [Psychromonas ingrahamii]ABM04183.1 undecaprenyl pyrophosphate phosphatase [Psychromonas ingrahamii 37]
MTEISGMLIFIISGFVGGIIGFVISRITSGSRQQGQSNTKAELDKTKAELDKTKAELDKTKAELDKTKAELDKTKAELDKTKAELDKTRAELDKTKVELDNYKFQVSNHFSDSAKLMGQIASSYQALYTHMAGQSKALLDANKTGVPFPQLEIPLAKKSAQETVEEALAAKKEASQSDTAKKIREIKAKEVLEIKAKDWMLQIE